MHRGGPRAYPRYRPSRAVALALGLACAACSGDDAPANGSHGDASHDAGGDGDAGSGTSMRDEWISQGAGPRSHYQNYAEKEITVETAAKLEVAWMKTMPGSVTGTPAIVDGVVYATAGGGTLALSLEDGSELWTSTVGATSSPAYADGKLFVDDSSHVLHAFDARTGEDLWQQRVDSHAAANGFSSPVPVGDVVLVGISSMEEADVAASSAGATFQGGVAAYHQRTGKLLWRHATAEGKFNGCAVWGTVSADPELGTVFAPTGNNYTGEASDRSDALFAADLVSGELVWNSQQQEGDVFHIFKSNGNPDWDFGATPIVYDAGGKTFVAAGAKSGQFWALDRKTGHVVWNVEVSPNGSAQSGGIFNNGAFDGERILVAGNSGFANTATLRSLDAATGDEVWMQALPGRVWAPITVANGVCFVPVDKELRVLDCATGDILGSHVMPGSIGGGPAIAEGHVVFGSGFSWATATGGRELYALRLK